MESSQSYQVSRLTAMKQKFQCLGVPDKPGIAYQILGVPWQTPTSKWT